MFRPRALDGFCGGLLVGAKRAALGFLCGNVLTAGLPTPARADFRVPATRQPSAQARTVRLTPGEQVDIVLSGYSSAHASLDFLLRSNPAHGTLGELRPTGRDTAIVTYTHRAADGPGVDEFSFAVRAANSAVSAAATVRLQIVEPPPRLMIAVPDTPETAGANGRLLEFGNARVGEETRRELTLENAGGGVAFGTLEPTAPWSAVAADTGAATYRLGRGERQRFTLVFHPGVARRFEGELTLGTGAGTLHLAGTGLPSPPASAVSAPKAPAETIAPITPTSAAVNTPPPAASPIPAPPLPTPTPAPVVSTAEGDVGESTAGNSPIVGFSLVGADRHSLTLSWTYPETPPKITGPWPTHYRAELQKIRRGADELLVEWQPHADVLWSSEGGSNGGAQTWRASLRGLPADVTHIVRIVALDANGNAFAPSPFFLAATLAPARPLAFFTLNRLLLLALAGGGFLACRQWRQRRSS